MDFETHTHKFSTPDLSDLLMKTQVNTETNNKLNLPSKKHAQCIEIPSPRSYISNDQTRNLDRKYIKKIFEWIRRRV